VTELSAGALVWAGFDGEYPRCRVALPTYPFEHKSYWIDPGKPSAAMPAESAGQRRVDPLDEGLFRPVWRENVAFAPTPDLYGEGVPASIPGAPPRLDRPLVGCPFHTRCDRAFARCVDERPLLKELDGDRSAACHLNDVVAEVV